MIPHIEVLLATYNSARWLDELLASLAAQGHDDFHLVVADDGSDDETLAILERWRGKFRNPVEIRRRMPPSGSAMANFSALIAEARGDYVFLADHDDLWAPDKVSRQLDLLRRTEAEAGGPKVPVLIHSDLSVIDAQGRMKAPSYWAWKSIEPAAGARLDRGLMHATVTGCAAAMNGALARRAAPVPEAAIMHDWWLALVAAGFGRVAWDPAPLTAYRVHGGNASRPRKVGIAAAVGQLDRLGRLRANMRRRYKQGRAFRDRYVSDLPPDAARVITHFVAASEAAPGLRQAALVRGGFRWPGVWRNLVQMVFA